MLLASKYSLCLLVAIGFSGCMNSARFSSFEPNGVNARYASTTPTRTAALSVAIPDFYLVKPGDTLYSIAFRFGLDYQRLANGNGIGMDYRIVVGQSITLKESDQVTKSQAAVQAEPAKKVSTPAKVSVTKKNSSKTVIKSTKKETYTGPADPWTWPHKGKIVRTFVVGSSSNKGIDIGGQIGDSVLAATSGTVVYAGNGLPGYGNLIIIEHRNSLLSAYAFAEQILVKEKDRVQVGQQIATMGTQGDEPSLHFEIRKNGKPVDPQRILPGR